MFGVGRRARSQSTASYFSVGFGSARETGHLATEAVAAYVDGELGMRAHMRASGHLQQCLMCTEEVEAQRRARSALRGSGVVEVPAALLGELCTIPQRIAGGQYGEGGSGRRSPGA